MRMRANKVGFVIRGCEIFPTDVSGHGLRTTPAPVDEIARSQIFTCIGGSGKVKMELRFQEELPKSHLKLIAHPYVLSSGV